MHLETYVESFTLLDGLKLLIPFINPIVPIEIKSSKSMLVEEYFLQTCATKRKFFSINIFLASSSPFFNNSKYFCSSSLLNGSGKRLLFEIYPTKKNSRL